MKGPAETPATVLHVVVGHGLPTYFLNSVRAVRAVAPADSVLVIDNASPDPQLRHDLSVIADQDDKMSLVVRAVNDIERNRKVGSLYAAYEIAFDAAIAGDYDFLHLVQADFQTLWWDAELVARSQSIFNSRPKCVNIQMQLLSRDKILAEDLVPADGGLMKLRRYGLTDTGLYHLGRWGANGMRFGPAEQGHGPQYLADGLEVICHPWPTDAPIPWPAVVRNGVQRGREISTRKPFLLKPPSPEDVARIKGTSASTWLEDVCVPWGWICASPMWVTGLDSIDYWVLRYRDARRNGLRNILPRPDLRGVDRGDRHGLLRVYRYRPSLYQLFVAAPAREVIRRLRSRRGG